MANCTGFQGGLGVASDRMVGDPALLYGLDIGAACHPLYQLGRTPTCMYFGDEPERRYWGGLRRVWDIDLRSVYQPQRV